MEEEAEKGEWTSIKHGIASSRSRGDLDLPLGEGPSWIGS